MPAQSWLLWIVVVCVCSACTSTRTIGQSDINKRDIQDTQAQSFPQDIENDVPTNTPVEVVNTGAWLRMLGMTHDRVAIARLNTDEIILWGAQTQRSFTNITQVAYGLYHTVLLYDDGSVEVYGTNEFGQLDIPDSQLRFEYVAAGETFTVGLTSDGRIVGWGRAVVEVDGTQYSITPYPLDVTDAVQFAVYKHYTLVSHRDGTISLWGDDQTKRAARFDLTVAKYPQQMAISDSGIFVLDQMQQPHWFPFYKSQDAKPIQWPQGIKKALEVADSNILIVTDSGEVYMLGGNTLSKPIPQKMRHDAPIMSMDGYIMGLDMENKFFMWHEQFPHQPFPMQMNNAVEINIASLGMMNKVNYVFYRLADNTMRMFEHGVESFNYPYEVNSVAWMSDSHDTFAIISLSGELVIWGIYGGNKPITPDWARPLRYVDVPTQYGVHDGCSVGILADGSFVEWGPNGESPCTYQSSLEPSLQGRDIYPRPPIDATQLVKVVRPIGRTKSIIGLRADGRVVTWGRYGQERPATVPSNATDVIDIVAGVTTVMALRRDGQIVLWDTEKGELLAPVEVMPSRMIRITSNGYVSLRTDGTLVVWSTESLQTYPGFADAIDVDSYQQEAYSGENTLVVLHQDGTITSFGQVYALPKALRVRMASQ